MVANVQCPVCTLFLHAGMDLSDHLETHPKEQVIKALVQMTITKGDPGVAGGLLSAALLGGVQKSENSNSSDSQSNCGSGSANMSETKNKNLNEKVEQDLSNSSSMSNSAVSIASTSSAASGSSSSSKSSLNFASKFPLVKGSEIPTETTTTVTEMSQTKGETITRPPPPATVPLVLEPKVEKSNSIHSYQQQRNESALDATLNTFNNISNCPQLPRDFSAFSAHRFNQQQQQQQQLPQQQRQVQNQPPIPTSQQHIRQQQQSQSLPPPPPPMPQQIPTNYGSLPQSSTHALQQTAVNQRNQFLQHQQQQQQQILQQNQQKIGYSLPPPPPLQLYSYQTSSQPQHQKPPPAYGTAISQIRSQHNQNKQQQQQHNFASSLAATTSVVPISSTQITQHHQKLPPPPSINSCGSVSLSITTAKHSFHGKQTLSNSSTSSTGRGAVPLLSNSYQYQNQRYGAVAEHDLRQHLSNQQQHHHHHPLKTKFPSEAHRSSSKLAPPLTAWPSSQQSQPSSSLSFYSTSTSRQTPTKSAAPISTNASPSSSSSSTSSSVLRYAESPVAHYLERDNGDFIVQETPKHIVECVETDNGEFSVIERIYQSPPSVLHIHEDEDDEEIENENENENGRNTADENCKDEKSKNVEKKSKTNQNLKTEKNLTPDDEEEFMSLDGDSDMEEETKTEVIEKKDILDRFENNTKEKLEPTTEGKISEEIIAATGQRQKIDVENNTNVVDAVTTEENSASSTVLSSPSASLLSTSSSSSSSSPVTNSTNSTNSNSSLRSVSISVSNSNSNSEEASTTANHTQQRKKSSKNAITVLSDVQLNITEYLDLVGNIFASSKMTMQKSFPSNAPIPLVKVEKEEPIDEDDIDNIPSTSKQMKHNKYGTAPKKGTETIKLLNETPPPTLPKPNANANETELSSLVENNSSSNDKLNILKKEEKSWDNEEPEDDDEDNVVISEDYAVSQQRTKEHLMKKQQLSIVQSSSNATSVIRMAITSQQQSTMKRENNMDKTTTAADEILMETKEEVLEMEEMEDLTGPTINCQIYDNKKNPQQQSLTENDSKDHQLLVQQTTEATKTIVQTLPPPPPLKKGPKKLVIKPKSSNQTEINANSLTTTTTTTTTPAVATTEAVAPTTTATPKPNDNIQTEITEVNIKKEKGVFETMMESLMQSMTPKTTTMEEVATKTTTAANKSTNADDDTDADVDADDDTDIDEKPTTSLRALAAAQREKEAAALLLSFTERNDFEAIVKNEPLIDDDNFANSSILEQHLKKSIISSATCGGGYGNNLTEDKPLSAILNCRQEKNSTRTQNNENTNFQMLELATMEFATSSSKTVSMPSVGTNAPKKQITPTATANFLSPTSIFSTVSISSALSPPSSTSATTTTSAAAAAAVGAGVSKISLPPRRIRIEPERNSGNHNKYALPASLQCDDEFIAHDACDAVQEIVISSSYSSQSSSDAAINNLTSGSVGGGGGAGSVDEQHQKQQIQNHNLNHPQNFTEYPFSFFYHQHQHPHHHHHQDATNAATIASGSNSVSLEDSTSSAPAPSGSNGYQSKQRHDQPQSLQSNHFGTASNGNASSQWYHHHHAASTAGITVADFEALAVDCTAAVDSGDVGKYLDLDACKRTNIEVSIPAAAAPSSTSSSFTGATESSLAGVSTVDTLNIRTDEKMPAKGEISEQESNCDVENSWSQPTYSEVPTKFFKTSFPGLFQQENCWNQDEFFTVQDLSGTTNSGAQARLGANGNNIIGTKSFDFRLPLEATTSAAAHAGNSTNPTNTSNTITSTMPSTSVSKRKRKQDQSTPTAIRAQPTATITSQEMLPHSHLSNYMRQHQQTPSFIAANLLAGPSNIAAGIVPQAMGPLPAIPSNIATQPTQRVRRKIYQCTHCDIIFVKLRDRNSHMIIEHNYIRQNRRLVCIQPGVSVQCNNEIAREVPSSADMATIGIANNRLQQSVAASGGGGSGGRGEECIEDSKHGILNVKIETSDPCEQVPSQLQMTISANISAKSEFIDENDSKALIPTNVSMANSNEMDTKPIIQTPLAVLTPATKLATLYRMLVSFNMTTLKRNQNLSETDEKLIETSIFFCYVCRCNFNSVKLYDAHLREHPAECFTCGKKFQRWKNFSLHLKRHLGWKEFGCSVCDKKFVVRSALVEHMRMHTGQTPLRCKICGKYFKRYSNLTQHRRRHTKMIIRRKEYVCHCGEVLPSKARFLWHKETHDTKPKCCPHCCDRFVHANSLRRHIRLAHSDKFDYAEPMECPMCKQIFAKSSIKAHMATHSMDAVHSCAICNKSFSTKWNLKIHLWVHANRTAKPFKCEHCPKAFVREVDFKNHMNAHKQIKPYTCEYCGCKFIRKYNYMRHRREHHGKKKFTCDLCKKSFHRHYYLIEHRRIHTGERPFTCTICGKSSTTKTNHNKHLKIHHSRDPFTVEA